MYKRQGRDFGVILACLNELGYAVEWRVVNAAVYGAAQRRRRTFIFAYKKDTNYGLEQIRKAPESIILSEGLMSKAFPIEKAKEITETDIPTDIVEVSDKFAFDFRPAGYMVDGHVYTTDVVADNVQFLETKAQSQNRPVEDSVTPADFANNSVKPTDMNEEVFADFGDSIEISDDDIAF